MTRIALITGASSGMGREMARLLSARVSCLDEIWLVARRKERLCALSDEISARTEDTPRVRCFALDLCEEASFSLLQRELSDTKSSILFLVNASGFGKLGPVSEISPETAARMVRLNAEALTRLCGICLPFLVRGHARILNFASAAAFLPQPGFAVYAATKSYVLSYSEALGEELKSLGIGVTAVCPGPVQTEFFALAEEFCEVPLYKKLFYADPESVCRKALSDAIRRRPLSVYGLSMKGFALLSRIIPHRLLFFAMRLISRPMHPDRKQKAASPAA